MKSNKPVIASIRLWAFLALTTAILMGGPGAVLPVRASETFPDKIGVAATESGKMIQDTRQSAETRLQELWKRVDEKRLKNRTRDEIFAWLIMGLLVGGLIQRFSTRNWRVTLLLGLVGAFIGGIAANLFKLNLHLGPVLIRYEELLASLLGGVLILLVARLLEPAKPRAE